MTDDQLNDEFANIIFGSEENAEWADQAAAEAPKPEPKPLKHTGLSYVDDVVLALGAVESRYALRVDGKTLFYVHVELGCSIEAPASIAFTGQAISWHPIVIKSVDNMQSISTEGAAVVAAHEGETAHVDGHSVAAYVLPRALRYLSKFYGI